MIFLAMRSGMSFGELQKLEWVDVNLSQNVVFLRDTKNSLPRSVPLSNEAKAVLENIAPIQDRKALGQLASNKAQRWVRIIVGFVSLGVLGIWSISIGNKNNIPIPKQSTFPKVETEQPTSSGTGDYPSTLRNTQDAL